ncbi:hypothetical protein NDU88_006066 [Pleurodeles waltl]|uniref:Uncharacterized protein n=1 Tax=Pleurodeles waltl TaxID=8319 RepID=A0AAV7TXC8_PLEWA|nr:hypothetical protein NDU88_006066 [Pleurodeles waltl]
MKRARPAGRKSPLPGSGCVGMTQELLSNPGVPSGLCGKTVKMKRGLNLSVNNDRGKRSKGKREIKCGSKSIEKTIVRAMWNKDSYQQKRKVLGWNKFTLMSSS